MSTRPAALLTAFILAHSACGQDRPVAVSEPPPPAPEIAGFTVRPGYRVGLAADVPGARFMELDDRGTLYVSRPVQGDILALRDTDGDGFYETQTTFLASRPQVHGLCFRGGWLWFSTTGTIGKARSTTGDGVADETVEVVPAGSLPAGGTHWWRSLLVTESFIYTSIGDARNIGDQSATEREKVWRFSPDGTSKVLFASGIRNTEKLRLRPLTDEVWGCDHGSDDFGKKFGEKPGDQGVTDLNPPDELNHYTEGGFYGHPFVVGNRLPRYEYADRPDIHDLASRTIPPEWSMPAHWAVNGFAWIDPVINAKTGMFPRDHGGDMFVAAHGSWNSTEKVGYCVARILFDGAKPYGLLKIVSTLGADGQSAAARPVDCVQARDGSVLFSSDTPIGRIYRITGVRAAATDGDAAPKDAGRGG